MHGLYNAGLIVVENHFLNIELRTTAWFTTVLCFPKGEGLQHFQPEDDLSKIVK